MTIVRAITAADRDEWVRMRDSLWPGSPDDHEKETRAFFEQGDERLVVLVAEADERVVGFLELDQRRDAPGCSSSPVPFIEGWYVEETFRGRGVGRALVLAAERWATDAGFTEIASDAEIGNDAGIAAHRALGYLETERSVSFRKQLRPAEEGTT